MVRMDSMMFKITAFELSPVFEPSDKKAFQAVVTIANGDVARAVSTSDPFFPDEGSGYLGKVALEVIDYFNKTIGPSLVGMDVTEQTAIDHFIDQQVNETINNCALPKLGLVLKVAQAVSLAVCRAGASVKKSPLYMYLAILASNVKLVLPVPAFNLITRLPKQEFIILPADACSFKEAMEMAVEVHRHLNAVIKKKDTTNVGDEGGFAPNIQENKEGIELLKTAIAKAGYIGRVVIGMDVIASEFHGEFLFTENNDGSGDAPKGLDLYWEHYWEHYKNMPADVIERTEDPFDQDAWEKYSKLTAENGEKVQIVGQIVGDDLLITDLKVNQIGSVTKWIEAVKESDGAWVFMTTISLV